MTKTQNIVKKMIIDDCTDIMDIFFALEKSTQPIAALALTPYLCLVVSEAYDWCKKMQIDLQIIKSKDIMEKIRAKTKLFSSDNVLSFSEQCLLIEKEIEIQYRYFKGLAKSYAPDFLIDDVGVYRCEGKGIGNTIQYAFDFSSFSKPNKSIRESSEEIKSFTTEIGSAMQEIITILSGKKYEIVHRNKLIEIAHKDYRFKRKFKNILTLIAYLLKCRINFLMFFVKRVCRENSLLYLRFLFLTYYSIKNDLSNIGLNNRLMKNTNDERLFRNAMVHYSLHGKISENEINETVVGYGLIEKYFGQEYSEFVSVIESKMLEILQILSRVCPTE